MKHKFLQEIIISVILILLLIFFIDPFMWWMPNGFNMIMLAGLLVVFSIFASIIWKERPKDEREGFHRMLADRAAYFIGAIVLVLGIVLQTLNQRVDPWLAIALGIMILAKIITLSYAKAKM
jgi:cobalamin synthase